MKITISNLDLAYTIDTYGMFTGESSGESELDYYRDEYNLTDDEMEVLEFDYNHAGVVTALAEASVELLGENLTRDNGVVENIVLNKTQSPQFYNYTTDSYTAEWTIDETKLKQYCLENASEYKTFVTDNWEYEFTNAIENSDNETQMVIALDFYTQNEYDREDYEMSMFEYESEAWYENTNLTPEAQAMIDKKQAEAELEAERIKNQTNLELGV